MAIGDAISWPKERAKDRRLREAMSKARRTKVLLAEWSALLLAAVLTAISAAAIAIVSRILASLREGTCSNGWLVPMPICVRGGDNGQWHPWPRGIREVLYVSLSTGYSALAAFLVTEISPQAMYSGLPALRAYISGFSVPGLLSMWVLPVKVTGLVLIMATPLWLGQEAPLVHVAAAAAAFALRLIPRSLRHIKNAARCRDLTAAAASAGIAVAFGAPIGGVLFSLEEFAPISKSVLWRAYVCATIASLLIAAIDPYRTGHATLFHVKYDRKWHSIEIVPFVWLGVLGGAYGALCSMLNADGRAEQFIQWICPKVVKRRVPQAALATALASLIALPSFLLRMPLEQMLQMLLADCTPSNSQQNKLCESPHFFVLMYALLVGAVSTPLIYRRVAVPSGNLLPTLCVGALAGRLMGHFTIVILTLWPSALSTAFCPASDKQCVTPGVYALVGAAACLTGVSRLTLTSVVIILELTGALSYVIPVMVGVMVAKWTADTLAPMSWDDMWCLRSRYPVTLPHGPVPVASAETVMRKINSGNLADATEGAEVDDGYVVGPGKDSLVPPLVIDKSAPLAFVDNVINSLGLSTVLFSEEGRVAGLLSRKDLWNAMTEYLGCKVDAVN